MINKIYNNNIFKYFKYEVEASSPNQITLKIKFQYSDLAGFEKSTFYHS